MELRDASFLKTYLGHFKNTAVSHARLIQCSPMQAMLPPHHPVFQSSPGDIHLQPRLKIAAVDFPLSLGCSVHFLLQGSSHVRISLEEQIEESLPATRTGLAEKLVCFFRTTALVALSCLLFHMKQIYWIVL